jgi:hypothetical protein
MNQREMIVLLVVCNAVAFLLYASSHLRIVWPRRARRQRAASTLAEAFARIADEAPAAEPPSAHSMATSAAPEPAEDVRPPRGEERLAQDIARWRRRRGPSAATGLGLEGLIRETEQQDTVGAGVPPAAAPCRHVATNGHRESRLWG